MAAAVALGAFGAHALKARVPPDAIAIWQTAVDYHAWHALGLFGVGILMLHRPDSRALRVAASRSFREACTRSRSARLRDGGWSRRSAESRSSPVG